MAGDHTMTPGPLWAISIATPPKQEEEVSTLLESIFKQPACSYTDLETGETTVTVYWESNTPRRRPRATRRSRQAFGGAEKPKLRRLLSDARIRLKTLDGLEDGKTRVRLSRVRRQDWATSWKRHFKPLAIGNALLLRPSWSHIRPKKGQALVVLDPGLSFGTGHHPTTAFCLRQLARRRPGAAEVAGGRTRSQPGVRSQNRSFLDLGTGSGILAIAAAKLGYAPVDGLDIDPESVRIAGANAKRNRVAHKVRFFQKDLAGLQIRPDGRYDFICANLIANLLLSEQRRILSCLKPGGTIVLAGILKTEFDKVRQAYEPAGLRMVAAKTEKEWRSGAFRMNF
jgi:ribosomal protein L11 methyltransferase